MPPSVLSVGVALEESVSHYSAVRPAKNTKLEVDAKGHVVLGLSTRNMWRRRIRLRVCAWDIFLYATLREFGLAARDVTGLHLKPDPSPKKKKGVRL